MYEFHKLIAPLKQVGVALKITPYNNADEYLQYQIGPDLDLIVGIDIDRRGYREIEKPKVEKSIQEEELKVLEEIPVPLKHENLYLQPEESYLLGEEDIRVVPMERYLDDEYDRRTIIQDLQALQANALKPEGKMHLAMGKLNMKFSKDDKDIEMQIDKRVTEACEKTGFFTKITKLFQKSKPSLSSREYYD
jgi:hypothetical protein